MKILHNNNRVARKEIFIIFILCNLQFLGYALGLCDVNQFLQVNKFCKKLMVNKSKLGKIPTFSLGLTPSDEGNSDDQNAMKHGKRIEKKPDQKRKEQSSTEESDEGSSDHNKAKKHGKKKEKKPIQKRKEQSATEESDEGSSDDNKAKKHGKKIKKKPVQETRAKSKQQTVRKETDEASSDEEKKDLDADQRLRHKLSIPKIYDLMKSIDGKRRKYEIIKLLNGSGFGGMLHICKWTKIHTFFVEWIVKRFEKDNMWIRLSNTDVLPLKEEDVHRVYELPMAGEQINPKLCSEAAIGRLRVELGLDANNAAIVNVKELEKRMDIIENPTAWVKGAICLIIHNILCPTNRSSVYLHYAEVLENASTYNWCSYVLQYMKDGWQNPKVANPLADFHFLMINYMEKMGKKSPFLTGIYKRPSLRDWDVKMANQDLQKVHELMGLDNGLTYGVKRLHSTEDGPLVMCFDADSCPLSKAEEHLNYCRGAIRVYTTAAETLQRRIVEGSVGTSRENDLVQNQSKKAEKNKRSNNEKEKAEKNSSIPQTITQEEESEGANLDNDNVAEEEIIAKMIDDLVKEACKIIDDSVKTSSNVQDEMNAKVVDDSMKQPSNAGLTLTQETILKFPEYLGDVNEDEGANLDNDNVAEEEIIAKMIDDLVKEACKIIDDSVKTSSNVQDEMNAKVVDDSMKQPSNAGLTLTQETILKFPEYLGDVNEDKGANLDNDNVAEDDINAKSVDKDDDDNEDDETNAKGIDEDDKEDEINAKGIDEDDNAERIDEDDDEEEIIAKMIDDSVKAACKIIDDSVKTSSNVQDEMNANSMKQPSNAGLTLTQETILKFPEYLGDVNEEINTNDSETPGLSATQETMLKFPEYFDNDSTKEKCSQSLALMLVPEAKGGEKPTECNEEIVLDATPLRSTFPDEIIDLDNVTTKKRKKHNMLYSDSTYSERRRAVKKSKYLESPYDDAVHESTSSELQKQLSTYAWSPELDPHDLLYCSDNKAHQYALERQALWSLQQDEWVSCLVDLERLGAFDKNNPAAFARFIDRLSKFKYIDWKDMDPNSLELIMTPAIIGKPGNHYVCFVVNLKRQKYEFLNSLTGDTLYNKNGTATVYKDMFDVLLNEVQVFVAELYKR
ncbi:hypothetical protein QL285_033790 [Trifolium repens]|nr:hypothetical protein QL285_033790 [Trifolium repens]